MKTKLTKKMKLIIGAGLLLYSCMAFGGDSQDRELNSASQSLLGAEASMAFLPFKSYEAAGLKENHPVNLSLMYGKNLSDHHVFIVGINPFLRRLSVDLESRGLENDDVIFSIVAIAGVVMGIGYNANAAENKNSLSLGGRVGLLLKMPLSHSMTGIIGTRFNYISLVDSSFREYDDNKLSQEIYMGIRWK